MLIAVAALIVVVVVAVVVGSGSSRYARVTGTAEQIRATQHVFLEANILVENLGAFTPPDESTADWLLTSHPVSKGHRGVDSAQYPWIRSSGSINVVSMARANGERIAQQRVITSVFGSGARGDDVAEMTHVIDSETGVSPRISAPGGAEIVKWLKVQINGTTAQLEADVNVWEGSLNLIVQSGRYRLVSGLDLNQVDASATLRFTAGLWRVVSFDQAPWQQAT